MANSNMMAVYGPILAAVCMSICIHQYECPIVFTMWPLKFSRRAWSEFSKLREADAISALEEFMASDQTRIRNKAAYFMGICKKRTY